jgi:hypothetical protein
MRACSSPSARRDSSSTATRRLRTASPSAHATTARAIVKTLSSTVVVKKFAAESATRAARPISDTRGGRAAASEPIANSPAKGTTIDGNSSCRNSPLTSTTTVTRSGAERRQYRAIAWMIASTIPASTSSEVASRVPSSSTTRTRKHPTSHGIAAFAKLTTSLRVRPGIYRIVADHESGRIGLEDELRRQAALMAASASVGSR